MDSNVAIDQKWSIAFKNGQKDQKQVDLIKNGLNHPILKLNNQTYNQNKPDYTPKTDEFSSKTVRVGLIMSKNCFL